MPDEYTTTRDPLRQMVCSDCGGHFAGRTYPNVVNGLPFCDNCLEKADG